MHLLITACAMIRYCLRLLINNRLPLSKYLCMTLVDLCTRLKNI